jgi:hypothetical protein
MSFMDIHDRAMAIADRAREAERLGDKKGYMELLRAAYHLEQQAARSLDPLPESEPTRTVLFRSASSLAFQAGDYQEASSLAFDGLTGHSPEENTAELLEIASEAKFRLQLIGENLQVQNAEITLTLRGPRVSVGLAPAKQTTMILRRVEILLRGRVEKIFRNKVQPRELEWPVGSSKLFDVFMRPVAGEEFAVAFRIGLHEQLSLFSPPSLGDQIVSDFMKDLQTVISEGHASAKRDKFSSAVLRLEPDGKDVTSIEITSMVAGELISVRIPPRKGPTIAGAEGANEKLSTG